MFSLTRTFLRAARPSWFSKQQFSTERLPTVQPVSTKSLEDYENDLESQFKQMLRVESRSPLEPVQDPSIVDTHPHIRPAFNFAAYVNKSESLQHLVKLGVDLHKLEKRKGIPQFILQLDFERDMREHLKFLTEVGVPLEGLGEFVTKNPLIFKEDLGDMEVRINYLESKRFLPEQISRIVCKNPFWLMISTKRIDKRLGYFQKTFKMMGDEVRLLTAKQPRIITYNLEHIRQNTFTVREEMGFEPEEMKQLLLSKPKLWMMSELKFVIPFSLSSFFNLQKWRLSFSRRHSTNRQHGKKVSLVPC